MIKNPPIIKKVVRHMGGTFEEFVPERGCFYINIFGKRILIERKFSLNRQSFVSSRLTKCKDLTYRVLLEYGLPTPETKCFYNRNYDRKDAIAKLQELSYPIIIKDAQGSNSKGIFSFIGNCEEAVKVLESNMPRYKSMIAQQMVFGKEFRLLVLHDRVIGALEMIPPFVIGDGKLKVAELIEKKQQKTEMKTEIDEKLTQILKEQGYYPESVIPEDKRVFIKKNSSLAEGGEMKDVTDFVNKEIEKKCVKASEVIGRDLVGIDVICEDISKNPNEQSFNIIEINGKPDLYIHYKPQQGKIRNVVEEIINFMVKNS